MLKSQSNYRDFEDVFSGRGCFDGTFSSQLKPDSKPYQVTLRHYHSKFPVIKKTQDISADSLILTCKIVFSEYSLPRKIMSDAGSNFISD